MGRQEAAVTHFDAPMCRIVDDVTPRAKRHCTVDREPSLVRRYLVVLPCCLACLPCLLRHPCLIVQALALCDAPQVVVDVTGCGPNAAVQLLRQSLPSDVEGRRVWCQRAKIAAIIGSCPKSRDSFGSGSCVVYTSSAGPPPPSSLWARYTQLDQLCRSRARWYTQRFPSFT